MRRFGFLIGMFGALLGGCGGGGHDLSISFSYVGATANLFNPAKATASISGLDGHTPHCTLSAGSLPPGLTLASDCSIGGIPTAIGHFPATITLTVDGFNGAIPTSITFDVNTPTLSALQSSQVVGAPNQVVIVGSNIQGLVITSLANYAPQPGDAVQYSVVAGQLPSGLTLSPTDGTLNGRPTGFGTTSMSVGLSITHAGQTFVADPVTLTVREEAGPLQLSYANCCTSVVGESINVMPTTSYVPVPGSGTTFRANGGLPPGIDIDPGTGKLSGVPSLGGTYSPYIVQDVLLPDGSTQSTPVSFSWHVAGFDFQYAGHNVAIAYPGSSFSLAPTVLTGLLPTDVYSFSVEPYPGSIYNGNTASGTPVPPWLHIDPATGALSGTFPMSGISYQWELNIMLTVVRNGTTFKQPFYFVLYS